MHDHPNRALSVDAVRPQAPGAYGVMNTLRSLGLLAAAPRSAPELAGALGVSARTARRLLQRLAAEGYALQDSGHRRRYRPTLRLAAVASHVLDGAALPRAGGRCVAELAAATGASAHLWIWASHGAAVCVAHAPADGTRQNAALVIEPAADAAAAVLAPARARLRSCAFAAGDARAAAAAAAVLDRGRVVAALGLTGDVRVEHLAVVAQRAARLTRDLASAGVVSPRAPA